MIATTTLASQTNLADINSDLTPAWQRSAADAITDPAELLQILGLDTALLPAACRAAQIFGLRVPRSFVTRIRRGDPFDPLLLQILPLSAELDAQPGFGTDPVG